MTLSEITEYLIIGIICGGFATFAPVMFGYIYDVILRLLKTT